MLDESEKSGEVISHVETNRPSRCPTEYFADRDWPYVSLLFGSAMRRDDEKARDANSGICPEATRERTSMRRFPVETPERRHLRCSKRHPDQPAAEPRGGFCRVVQMTSRGKSIGTKEEDDQSVSSASKMLLV